MTLFAQSTGKRTLLPHKLTTTSATTLFTSATGKLYTLESLYICCDSSGSTFSLWIEDDNSNSYYLIKGVTLAANTSLPVTDQHIPFPVGWSLKAIAGTANKIDIVAVVLQSNPTQNER